MCFLLLHIAYSTCSMYCQDGILCKYERVVGCHPPTSAPYKYNFNYETWQRMLCVDGNLAIYVLDCKLQLSAAVF